MSHNDDQEPPTRRTGPFRHESNDSTLGRPKVDQGPLNSSSMSAPTITTDSYLRSPHPRNAQDGDGDDKMSRRSADSYRTELDALRFLRKVQGRPFNTLNETYCFPFDETEWSRLNKRHVMFILALGGLYPAADTVGAILAPQEGEQKRILDLGTGTGIWATDMARKFPHAEVIGIDLAPIPLDSESVPPNCRFEIDDVELGLTHFQGQFDVVHARLLILGLKDFPKSMTDIHNCLKPGGIMIWIESDFNFFTSDIHVYRPLGTDANPTGTWIGRFLYEMSRASMILGSDLEMMERALDGGLWGDSLMDPDTWKCGSVYLPIGPWANHEDPSISQRLKYIGALNRQDLYDAHSTVRVLLEKASWPADTLDEWARLASEEMSTMETPVQCRIRMAWGRRRAGPDEPAPPLSPISTSNIEEEIFASTPPYPLFFTYDTQEQALAEAALRNQSRNGFIPPPLPGMPP